MNNYTNNMAKKSGSGVVGVSTDFLLQFSRFDLLKL